ncbi:g12326 [Coccomyxa viridis]|uniref:G12326 protein n=1 Tax=Coccomyxa viridis TaxID=1274662 RepID=A0ABP1GFL4_9CHLO
MRVESPDFCRCLTAAAPGPQKNESSTQGRSAELELQEMSYRVIHLEGCDYLIARTSEGKLDLRDIFVQDKELGISSRPQVVGDIPEQPLYFQEWPWVVEFTGDRVNGKMPWKRVEKMFLVEIVPPTGDSDYTLNLERIYELHHKRKDVKRGEVHKSASIDDDTDPMEITLRITRDGFYLELLTGMPDIEDIVVAEEQRLWAAEQAQARQKSAASVASTLGGKDMEATADALDPMIEADPSDLDAALDPIDAMSENDFDGPDDTPAVDLGF